METIIPTFETDRLILKQISQADVSAYTKYFVDYEVVRFLSAHVPWPYPENGIDWFLNNMIMPNLGKTRWFWGIYLKSNPLEMIGGIDLFQPGIPENRGFWLGRPFWKKGYMTEAVVPVTDYAFDVLGFEKLIFSNALGNDRSRRVKEKTGARLVGTKPSKFVDPSFSESELWELTKGDWQKFRAKK